ncbi:hypothetical protein DFH07DRAFT_777324 [Mycena maculata]|uniref:Uncharacterized protein n=1 Tax=Mycena maculata TaxID=230809 RepID=A0AAD7N2N5_9AGAR|nr:hypothetical protein DFH07DRAFT_777324 [Mycena maculata]
MNRYRRALLPLESYGPGHIQTYGQIQDNEWFMFEERRSATLGHPCNTQRDPLPPTARTGDSSAAASSTSRHFLAKEEPHSGKNVTQCRPEKRAYKYLNVGMAMRTERTVATPWGSSLANREHIIAGRSGVPRRSWRRSGFSRAPRLFQRVTCEDPPGSPCDPPRRGAASRGDCVSPRAGDVSQALAEIQLAVVPISAAVFTAIHRLYGGLCQDG